MLLENLKWKARQSYVVSVKQCMLWCWLTGETNCCCKSVKKEKKGYHMVLTAVSLSRWNESKPVATILNYCDKFSDSSWEVFLFGVFWLFLTRLMSYPHPEKVTLGIRDKRRGETTYSHADVCITQKREGVQALSLWNLRQHRSWHAKGEGCTK